MKNGKFLGQVTLATGGEGSDYLGKGGGTSLKALICVRIDLGIVKATDRNHFSDFG